MKKKCCLTFARFFFSALSQDQTTPGSTGFYLILIVAEASREKGERENHRIMSGKNLYDSQTLIAVR